MKGVDHFIVKKAGSAEDNPTVEKAQMVQKLAEKRITKDQQRLVRQGVWRFQQDQNPVVASLHPVGADPLAHDSASEPLARLGYGRRELAPQIAREIFLHFNLRIGACGELILQVGKDVFGDRLRDGQIPRIP
ncbi:hypothetical protein ACFQD0_22340 [Sulfitobacter aestuariivivens]